MFVGLGEPGKAKDLAGEQVLWAGETDRNTGQTSLGVWREERSWQQKVQCPPPPKKKPTTRPLGLKPRARGRNWSQAMKQGKCRRNCVDEMWPPLQLLGFCLGPLGQEAVLGRRA